MDLFRESSRISKSNKTDRDLLIYIAWKLGVATNQESGEKFGLTYSAVSQRVSVIKEMFNKDKELKRKYRHIKSQSRFDTIFCFSPVNMNGTVKRMRWNTNIT